MSQLELDENELLALAKKQLQEQGKIPKGGSIVYQYRATDPDDRGQYTFTYRWEEPEL